MNPVTINIKNGGGTKTIQVPWKADTNIQEALEIAFDQEKEAGRMFDFAVQYYGYFQSEYLGYLVVMVDKTYDNPTDVHDYWLFSVNGTMAQVGIDNYMVNAGDIIDFEYIAASPLVEANTVHKAKKEFYSQN